MAAAIVCNTFLNITYSEGVFPRYASEQKTLGDAPQSKKDTEIKDAQYQGSRNLRQTYLQLAERL